jgi:hypothetical protein
VRFGLRAVVQGTVQITGPLTVETAGLRTEFEADDKGHLVSVFVSARVSAEQFRATVGPGEGAAKESIDIQGDAEISGRIWHHLQALESHLAFSSGGAIERIRWDRPEEIRMPENDDERQYAAIPSFKVDYRDPRPHVTLTTAAAEAIVEASHRDPDDLVVPKAFWREGMNDYMEQRYVQAYYNFYFVVEGLFAEGKSSEAQVVKAFQQSTEMTDVTNYALDAIRRDAKHWNALGKIFDDLNCPVDVTGAQRVLIRLRGQLHHYSKKSKRTQANPFTEADFHSPSWFAMAFAQMALLRQDPKLPYAWPNGVWMPLAHD